MEEPKLFGVVTWRDLYYYIGSKLRGTVLYNSREVSLEKYVTKSHGKGEIGLIMLMFRN